MEYGYLRHVIDVFERLGYRVVSTRQAPARWDVLWAHEYPFTRSSFDLPLPLASHQKVNHFPGSGFITNKVNLATSGLKHIPKAFNLPNEKDKFLSYVSAFFCLMVADHLFARRKNMPRSCGCRRTTITAGFGFYHWSS